MGILARKKEHVMESGYRSNRRTAQRCVLVSIAPLALLCGGCERAPSSDAQAAQRATTGKIYATFYPVAYWTQRIAGDHADVINPCPADADPAYWMPADETLTAYQTEADLIVVNGANFEKWLSKVSLPEARVVDTTAAFKDEFIHLHDAVTHSHGPGGKHTHSGIDGHTWLDPKNAIRQATAIKDALARTYPAHAEDFARNLATLVADLEALDQRLMAVSEKIGNQTLFANHPAWNYVARTYGWNLKTFHLDPEEMPDEQELEKIRAALDETPAQYILWEATPAAAIEQRFVDDLGLTSIVYTPGETISAEQSAAGEDFLTIMNANVDRLGAALE
jgi:zinc transport system substrate-binding protein